MKPQHDLRQAAGYTEPALRTDAKAPHELENAQLTGTIYNGLTATTRDGKPARLAIIDEDGNIIEASFAVAREAWRIALAAHTNFLRGSGHLTVHSTPPSLPAPHKAAV